MESPELISELVSIKYVLIGILIILSVLLLTTAANAIGNFIARRNEYTRILRDTFVTTVQKFEDEGKYADMISECERRIAKYPDDIRARYYLGIAHNKNGSPGLALSAFERLKEIDPAWERKYVDEYMEDIRATMSGPSEA